MPEVILENPTPPDVQKLVAENGGMILGITALLLGGLFIKDKLLPAITSPATVIGDYLNPNASGIAPTAIQLAEAQQIANVQGQQYANQSLSGATAAANSAGSASASAIQSQAAAAQAQAAVAAAQAQLQQAEALYRQGLLSAQQLQAYQSQLATLQQQVADIGFVTSPFNSGVPKYNLYRSGAIPGANFF